MAKFEIQGDEWSKDAWSVVVTFITEPNVEGRHEVHVRFLVPTAPRDLLKTGARFSLMEVRALLRKD